MKITVSKFIKQNETKNIKKKLQLLIKFGLRRYDNCSLYEIQEKYLQAIGKMAS